MAHIPNDIQKDAIALLRVKAAETENPKTFTSQNKALESFSRFVEGNPIEFDDINTGLLGEWVSYLFYTGHTLRTVEFYIKNLSSLYGKAVKAGLTDDNGCFATVKARLRSMPPDSVLIDAKCFDRLRDLVLRDFSREPIRQLAKDLVLFAVYNGGLTFSELATYKKTDYTGCETAIVEIVERYSKPKNKYLFPLRQPKKTAGQLAKTIESLFREAMRSVSVDLPLYKDTIAIDLWAASAMKCGVSAADIAMCVGEKGGENALYSFVAPTPYDSNRITSIRTLVASSLSRNPFNWYAMQFRPKVSYESVAGRLKSELINLKDTFYPMEEIVRKVGRKMVSSSRPVVPGLLFLRCRATDINDIFRHIGDLAWGYRQTRGPRSPYATISPAEIQIYQRTIGSFTADMQIFPAGTVKLREGDRIEVIGGGFIGRTGIFDSEIKKKNKNGGRTIYRLRMIGENEIEWVVDADPRLVRKLNLHKI